MYSPSFPSLSARKKYLIRCNIGSFDFSASVVIGQLNATLSSFCFFVFFFSLFYKPQGCSMYFCTTQTLTLLTEFGRIYERMEQNEFSRFIQWRKVDCVGFCVKVRTSVCVTVRYY